MKRFWLLLIWFAITNLDAQEILVGSSREAVVRQLGEPPHQMVLGSTEEMVYDRFRITLKKGRVTDVQGNITLRRDNRSAPATTPPASSPHPPAAPAQTDPKDSSIDLATLKVEGSVTYQGKTLQLKTACAQWRPHDNSLKISFFPFDLTAVDVEIYERTRSPEDMKMPSPDPNLWTYTPYVEFHAYFSSEPPVSLQAISRATLEFRDFGNSRGDAVVASGAGSQFQNEFRLLTVAGKNFGDNVTFSAKSDSKLYKLNFRGTSRILYVEGQERTYKNPLPQKAEPAYVPPKKFVPYYNLEDAKIRTSFFNVQIKGRDKHNIPIVNLQNLTGRDIHEMSGNLLIEDAADASRALISHGFDFKRPPNGILVKAGGSVPHLLETERMASKSTKDILRRNSGTLRFIFLATTIVYMDGSKEESLEKLFRPKQ